MKGPVDFVERGVDVFYGFVFGAEPGLPGAIQSRGDVGGWCRKSGQPLVGGELGEELFIFGKGSGGSFVGVCGRGDPGGVAGVFVVDIFGFEFGEIAPEGGDEFVVVLVGFQMTDSSFLFCFSCNLYLCFFLFHPIYHSINR